MKTFYKTTIARFLGLTLSLVIGFSFFGPQNIRVLAEESQSSLSAADYHFDGLQSEVIGKQNFIDSQISKGDFLLTPAKTIVPNSSCLSQCYCFVSPSDRDAIPLYLSSKNFRI